MTVHLVLYRPRADASDEERDALMRATVAAARSIPSVRRFLIGSRVAVQPNYVMRGFPEFPYVALVEFDDEAGLHAYVEHPAHAELGRRFNELAEAALIYDFNVEAA
ncbi:MAG: Dabb family protein [Vicinamibacteraceae bacterium]